MAQEKESNLLTFMRELHRIIYFAGLFFIRPLHDIITEINLRFYYLKRDNEKRILGYWDFNRTGGSLGDFITFLEILSILRRKYSLDNINKNIDVCFIHDDSHPDANNTLLQKSFKWKQRMISLVSVNPHIGSVYYFNSSKEFARFYSANKARYIKWPTTQFPLYVPTFPKKIEDYCQKQGGISPLVVPRNVLIEVYSFHEKYVRPVLPVIINIRKSILDTRRNSNIKEIYAFMKHYLSDERFKFIVICNKDEFPLEFRRLKNILFSKDYFDDLIYDLAFIKSSYISIFPSSGMFAFGSFSNVPYIMFGNHGKHLYTAPPRNRKFLFLKDYQRFYHGDKTHEWMISEFEDLIKYLQEHKLDNYAQNRILSEK